MLHNEIHSSFSNNKSASQGLRQYEDSTDCDTTLHELNLAQLDLKRHKVNQVIRMHENFHFYMQIRSNVNSFFSKNRIYLVRKKDKDHSSQLRIRD